MSDDTPALLVEDLSIRLPAGGDRAFAVENIAFSVARREIVCLVGESGSGKSMIAHALLSLLPRGVIRTSGRIHLDGQDIGTLRGSALRRLRGGDAAMIFQEPLSSLNPLKRVGEQIAESIVTHQRSMSRVDLDARVQELIAQVGLPHPLHIARSYPFELSGGQRQRVMIATAMANRPKLLIADEPTTALDVTTQRQILKLIDDLRQTREMGVLLITHDFGVVADVADRVVVLRNGRIEEQGPASDVLTRPQADYTRRLIAAIPKIDPHPRETSAAGAPLLVVENLSKTFVVRRGLFQPPRVTVAADGISLTLHEGETLAVVGESGSGKSTLGRMIMQLSRPDAGSVRLAGDDLGTLGGEALRQARRRLQIVFQDPFASLDPRQKVGDAVARGPRAFGMERREAMAAARAILARVGLSESAADRYPHEFSGGQRQRVCIARAVILKPQVLIADEAVSALDVSVQAQVLELFADLRREMNLAMIFITHDLRVAAGIADRILVLQNGRVVEEGSIRNVFQNPRQAYTRNLLDAMPGRRLLERPAREVCVPGLRTAS